MQSIDVSQPARKKRRVVVLASGNGSGFQSLIDYLNKIGKEASWEIVFLITNNHAAGALNRADKAGILWASIENDDDESLSDSIRELLDEHKPDLVVMAGFLRKLTAIVLNEYENKIVNIHPGPLPETTGLYGLGVHRRVARLMSEGNLEGTAVNVHFADENYDTGTGIVTYPVTVPEDIMAIEDPDPDEKAKALQQYVLKIEHRLLPLVIDLLMNADEGGIVEHLTSTSVVVRGQTLIDRGRLLIDLP